jgi:hypothetical protein
MKRAIHRRRFLHRAAGIGTAALVGSAVARAGPAQPAKHHAMVFWFAHNVCRAATKGRVVDQGYIVDVVEKCARHGINTIYFQPRYVGPAIYRSKVVAPFDVKPWLEGVPGFQLNELHPIHGRALEDVLRRFDPYDVAAREVKRQGLDFIAQISIFDTWFPILVDAHYQKHPEQLLVDQTQKVYAPGLPCYAEPGAIEYCLAEIRELVERGADGISLALGSHQLGFWDEARMGPRRPDALGFNPPLVREYEQRYGVNVLEEDFEPARWHSLHGEFFTAFLRRVKTQLEDKRLIVGAVPEGFLGLGGNARGVGTPDYASQSPACRINFEWRKWLVEGIVDGLRVYSQNVDSVEQMKRQVDSGAVYFSRETHLEEKIPVYREQLNRVQSGNLDGFVLHEESYFETEVQPRLWEIFDPAQSPA